MFRRKPVASPEPKKREREITHTDGSKLNRTRFLVDPTTDSDRVKYLRMRKGEDEEETCTQSISPWPSPGRTTTTGKAIRRMPTSDMQPTATDPIKTALAILWVLISSARREMSRLRIRQPAGLAGSNTARRREQEEEEEDLQSRGEVR